MNWVLCWEIFYQVLPDGSVLRINKTLVQDTDEEGNGFFFQSSIHQILTDDEYTEDEIEDNAEEIEDVEEDIEDTVNSSPVVNDDDDDEGLGFVDEDPTFNEVLDEKFPTASVEDLLDWIFVEQTVNNKNKMILFEFFIQ